MDYIHKGLDVGGQHGFGGSSGHMVVCMDSVNRVVTGWYAWIRSLNVIIFLINDEFKCMTKYRFHLTLSLSFGELVLGSRGFVFIDISLTFWALLCPPNPLSLFLLICMSSG